MTKEYWCIILENFEGNSKDIYYFGNFDIAKRNFFALVNKYRNYAEFYLDAEDDDYEEENECEWFDYRFSDEDLTYVYLQKAEVPTILNEIIF